MNTDRFKFRVWDRFNKRYYDSCNVAIDGDGRFLIFDLEHDEWSWFPDANPVVEQCTGVKDKKGMLIYEGDVIRFVEWPGTPRHIVAWNPKTCRWVLRPFKDINFEETTSLGPYSDEYLIVGNIHEEKWGIEK